MHSPLLPLSQEAVGHVFAPEDLVSVLWVDQQYYNGMLMGFTDVARYQVRRPQSSPLLPLSPAHTHTLKGHHYRYPCRPSLVAH